MSALENLLLACAMAFPVSPGAQEAPTEDTRLVRFSVAAAEYQSVPLLGFDVRFVPALMAGGDQESVGKESKVTLERDLAELLRRMPPKAHPFLRSVPIFVGVADPVAPCACYHVSAEWLGSHRFDPAKAKAVEIASASAYLSWRIAQPSMVMHELSHAYHDQVLGRGDGELEDALARMRRGGRYDAVMRWAGDTDRHYALTNATEYFAETTEALFGVNDFYPFVRGQLMAVDPEGAQLVASLWNAEDLSIHPMDDPQKTAAAEVDRLHRFFVDWFSGALPESDEGFRPFKESLDGSFQMVTPTGARVTGAELIARLRESHGKRRVRIDTKLISATVPGENLLLVVYEEHQAEGSTDRVLVSTALLQRAPRAPGGWRWRHVHETERED